MKFIIYLICQKELSFYWRQQLDYIEENCLGNTIALTNSLVTATFCVWRFFLTVVTSSCASVGLCFYR